jgi:Protein of unknown function (DUF4242)
MPRYLVERDFGHITEAEFDEAAARYDMVGAQEFPDIAWQGTQVCSGGDGTTKAYCVYEAPSAERLQEHTDQAGRGEITRILEVVGTLSPEGAAL